VLNAGLPLGRKLFEEVDKPTGTKIVFEDKEKAWLKEKAPGLAKLKNIICFLQEDLAAQAAHIFIATAA
jgi:hypothetical protein